MKNSLHIFGCSFSSPYHEETDEYRRYKAFCGGSFPNTWFELLSNKMNLNLINHGIPGAGNDMIFNRIIEQIRTISKDDVVIIGWSFLSRFMWANHETRKWVNMNFGRNHSVLNGNEDITEKTSNEIVFNRTSNFFKNVFDLLIGLTCIGFLGPGFEIKWLSSNIIYGVIKFIVSETSLFFFVIFRIQILQ